MKYRSKDYFVVYEGNYPSFDKMFSYLIEKMIYEALVEEVMTTPKPGLVDGHDNGAHMDMEPITFVKSAAVISPYLTQMFELGCGWKKELKELFSCIRMIGMKAENAMYLATDGINTHKGMIFSMGILSTAAGYIWQHTGKFDYRAILKITQSMTEEILEAEFQEMKRKQPKTNGERLYHKYGERGIRGEVQRGFPIIKEVAYPLLNQYLSEGQEKNRSYINVLLAIAEKLNDTCILSRSSDIELRWFQKRVKEILKLGGAFSEDGMEEIVKLNKECIKKHISPGGAADLLACTILLWKLEKYEEQLWAKRREKQNILCFV